MAANAAVLSGCGHQRSANDAGTSAKPGHCAPIVSAVAVRTAAGSRKARADGSCAPARRSMRRAFTSTEENPRPQNHIREIPPDRRSVRGEPGLENGNKQPGCEMSLRRVLFATEWR